MRHRPPPFTLRQLQYAVAVAETLSFRKAAEMCHVSQPSLSAQLARMEEALGLRLFERDRRRVLVTPAGREFIEHARRLLRDAGDLAQVVRRVAEPFTGALSVGVIPTISPYLLPQLTPVLREAYPRLALHWIEDKTGVLVRELEAGRLDAALLALEAEIGEVEHEVVARDPFVLVAPARHPLGARPGPVKPAELRGVAMLVLRDEHCFGEQAAAFCSDTSADVEAFRATSLTTLVQIVASGGGVTLLPQLAVAREVSDPQLRVRPFAEPAPARTIGLVWRKAYPFAESLREIARTIRRAWEALRAGSRAAGKSPPGIEGAASSLGARRSLRAGRSRSADRAP